MVAAALQTAVQRLTKYSESPRLDAEVLLAFVLRTNRETVLTHPEKTLTSDQVKRYRKLIERRRRRVPIPYLTGTTEFFGIQLHITPAVLVPRPFTELLIEKLLSHLKSLIFNLTTFNFNLTIADIGTGSGAIAIAVAKHFPPATIVATDISRAALNVARGNIRRLSIHNISCLHGSLLTPLHDRKPTIVIANLPYLTAKQLKEPSISREPRLALDGGHQGMSLIKKLMDQASTMPSIQTIVLELDPSQVRDTVKLLRHWSATCSIIRVSDGRHIRGLIAWQK